MSDNNKERLDALLLKRGNTLERTLNFNDNFNQFYHHLYEVCTFLNNELEQKTKESLRLFRDNPYERTASIFFVMVQLFLLNGRRKAFNLDNTENFPFIKFEGDEFTGYVKSTIIFRELVTKECEYSITELLEKDKVFEIMLSFLDVIYSLYDK